MKERKFFPKRPNLLPKVYAFKDNNPNYKGFLKIGYTTRDVEERVSEEYPIILPEEHPYNIIFTESALRDDGTFFRDFELHKWLETHGREHKAGEWFRCNAEDVRAAWIAVRDRADNVEERPRL